MSLTKQLKDFKLDLKKQDSAICCPPPHRQHIYTHIYSLLYICTYTIKFFKDMPCKY